MTGKSHANRNGCSFANGNGQSSGTGPGHSDNVLMPRPEHWWTVVLGELPR